MIFDQLVADYGAVTYEAFINLLVRRVAYLSRRCVPRTDSSFSRNSRSTLQRTRHRLRSFASRSEELQQTRSATVFLSLCFCMLMQTISPL